MPVYTYHCEKCEHEFEKYQSFSEDSLTTCPECGKETLRKVYSPALVVFKGSGYYVTDTKSHSPTLTPPNSKDSANGDKPTSDSDKPAEKKSETKAEAKVEKKAEKKTKKES